MSENTSIVICGEKVDIGRRVVLWNEKGGLNAYDESTIKVEDRKTGKITVISGKRYSKRNILKPNPSYSQLQNMIIQLFFHHTGNRTASSTFYTLHKERKLSVHFIIDDWNGTIYQTLDLKEKAWHGGTNNPISVGIEICSRANAKKYPNDYDDYHQKQYHVMPRIKRYDFVQNMKILGYDYNEEQYKSLIKLSTAIIKVFPKLQNADFPRTTDGEVIKSVLSNPLKHVGFICHYNTCKEKWDPVCLDHQRILDGVKSNGVDQGSTFEENITLGTDEET